MANNFKVVNILKYVALRLRRGGVHLLSMLRFNKPGHLNAKPDDNHMRVADVRIMSLNALMQLRCFVMLTCSTLVIMCVL